MRLRPLLLALLLGCCAAAPAPDLAPRAQRSANLSHITGTSRKIQMFLKNRHLQLLPDGTVNGTTDGNSIYTILQRTTVRPSELKIQGVATCLFLCMDSCGFLYANKTLSPDCIFTEHMETHQYNTYSRHGPHGVAYVALDTRGHPRRLQLTAGHTLANLSDYARVLTLAAPAHLARARHGHRCPLRPRQTKPRQTRKHCQRTPASQRRPPASKRRPPASQRRPPTSQRRPPARRARKGGSKTKKSRRPAKAKRRNPTESTTTPTSTTTEMEESSTQTTEFFRAEPPAPPPPP